MNNGGVTNMQRMTDLATRVYAKACGYKHTLAETGSSKNPQMMALYGTSSRRVRREMLSLKQYVEIQAKMLKDGQDAMGESFGAKDATVQMLGPYTKNETDLLFPSREWPSLRKNLKGDRVRLKIPNPSDWQLYEVARATAPENGHVAKPLYEEEALEAGPGEGVGTHTAVHEEEPLEAGPGEGVGTHTAVHEEEPLHDKAYGPDEAGPGEDVGPHMSFHQTGYHTVA
jgi:hypothetical protein